MQTADKRRMNDTECLDVACYPLMKNAHVVPPITAVYFGFRLFLHGALATCGVILNLICILVLVKSRLIKQWTYGMVMNFCLSDLLFCITNVIGFLPGLINGRYVSEIRGNSRRVAIE